MFDFWEEETMELRKWTGTEADGMAALAAEYRQSADQLEKRVEELRRQAKEAVGAESILLEQRIQTLRYEIGDLRKLAVWMERYDRG